MNPPEKSCQSTLACLGPTQGKRTRPDRRGPREAGPLPGVPEAQRNRKILHFRNLGWRDQIAGASLGMRGAAPLSRRNCWTGRRGQTISQLISGIPLEGGGILKIKTLFVRRMNCDFLSVPNRFLLRWHAFFSIFDVLKILSVH